jgi:hypothetical protein
MKGVMLGLIGLFLGAIAGGVIGIGLGLFWINVFRASPRPQGSNCRW